MRIESRIVAFTTAARPQHAPDDARPGMARRYARRRHGASLCLVPALQVFRRTCAAHRLAWDIAAHVHTAPGAGQARVSDTDVAVQAPSDGYPQPRT